MKNIVIEGVILVLRHHIYFNGLFRTEVKL